MKKVYATLALALAFIAGVGRICSGYATGTIWTPFTLKWAASIKSDGARPRSQPLRYAGHGAKAEQLLRDTEKELGLAIDAAKALNPTNSRPRWNHLAGAPFLIEFSAPATFIFSSPLHSIF